MQGHEEMKFKNQDIEKARYIASFLRQNLYFSGEYAMIKTLDIY